MIGNHGYIYFFILTSFIVDIFSDNKVIIFRVKFQFDLIGTKKHIYRTTLIRALFGNFIKNKNSSNSKINAVKENEQ